MRLGAVASVEEVGEGSTPLRGLRPERLREAASGSAGWAESGGWSGSGQPAAHSAPGGRGRRPSPGGWTEERGRGGSREEEGEEERRGFRWVGREQLVSEERAESDSDLYHMSCDAAVMEAPTTRLRSLRLRLPRMEVTEASQAGGGGGEGSSAPDCGHHPS